MRIKKVRCGSIVLVFVGMALSFVVGAHLPISVKVGAGKQRFLKQRSNWSLDTGSMGSILIWLPFLPNRLERVVEVRKCGQPEMSVDLSWC
jgi:hypothetical protein